MSHYHLVIHTIRDTSTVPPVKAKVMREASLPPRPGATFTSTNLQPEAVGFYVWSLKIGTTLSCCAVTARLRQLVALLASPGRRTSRLAEARRPVIRPSDTYSCHRWGAVTSHVPRYCLPDAVVRRRCGRTCCCPPEPADGENEMRLYSFRFGCLLFVVCFVTVTWIKTNRGDEGKLTCG